MQNESALLNDIVRALYPYARLYRINVIRVKNTQGRWLTTGVPKGYSDLSGYRIGDVRRTSPRRSRRPFWRERGSTARSRVCATVLRMRLRSSEWGDGMAEGGFVKISRMLKNWEHYGDAEMLKLFIHLLLSAAYKGYWDRDVYVGRGQLLTSTRGLAQELGFTHQHTRTLISTLKSTQEITQQSTHRGTLITIVKWDFYQGGIAESNTPYNTESNTESNTLTPKNQHTHENKKCDR